VYNYTAMVRDINYTLMCV